MQTQLNDIKDFLQTKQDEVNTLPNLNEVERYKLGSLRSYAFDALEAFENKLKELNYIQ